jgi:hypothetical protein
VSLRLGGGSQEKTEMKRVIVICFVVLITAALSQADIFWGSASSDESANSSTARDPILFQLDTATGTVGTVYTYSQWRTILDVAYAPGNVFYVVHSNVSDTADNKTFMLAKVNASTGAILSDTQINTLSGTDLPAWNALKYHDGKLYAVENSWKGAGTAEAMRGHVYEVSLNSGGDPTSATVGAYIGGYPAPDGALAYKDGVWYASDWRDDAPNASSWIKTSTDIVNTDFTATLNTESIGYFDGWDFEADGDLLGVSWMASYGMKVYQINLTTGNPTEVWDIVSQLPEHIISFSGLTAIPEPATIAILSLGGLLLKRKK